MRLCCVAFVGFALAGASAPQELNRLALDNGGEVISFLNAPFEDGDLYWKVYPAEALRRCDGVARLMGIETAVFDTDWSTQALWAYTVGEGVADASGLIVPTFTGAGVFVPGTSTTGAIFPSPGSGSPGYVSGWIYTETFLDTTGAPAPLLELTADGTMHWAFTHFFPPPGIADMDPATDATFQWLVSTDETAPDWTGLGISTYSGFADGTAGSFTPVAVANTASPQLSWFFDEPIVTVRLDADTGVGVETGIGGLQTPLQVTAGGTPLPGTTSVGVRLYRENGAPPTRFGIASLNVGPTLLDLGLDCLQASGADIALNPLDAGFSTGFLALGASPFVSDPAGPAGAAFADSALFVAGIGPAWVDLAVSWQAWEFDAVSGTVVGSSQVFENVFRAQ